MNKDAHIRDFVIGDAAQIIRNPVTNIATGRILDKAWFTLKLNRSDSDDEAVLQKVIGLSDPSGTNGIIVNGTGGTASVTFNIMSDDWTGVRAGVLYYHDVQVREVADMTLENPMVFTIEVGDFVALAQVTRATT